MDKIEKIRLEEAAEKYSNVHYYETMLVGDLAEGFKAGAEWQKEQFEKNRLAACDAQTREEYERETDFVDKFIAENQRIPTFSDAINYGIAWQKEKMLKKSEEDLDADIEMEWDSFNKHLAEYGEESEEVVWLNWNSFNELACYFYELGLKTRKEDKK